MIMGRKTEKYDLRDLDERRESEKALLEIYTESRGRLWWISNQLLQDEAAAEDIVQTVFEQFWRNGFVKGTKEEQFAYLAKVVENRSKDRIAALILESDKLLHLPGIAVKRKDPEETAVEKESVEEIIEEVKKLPDRDRELMQRLLLEGMTYDEVSQMMQVRKSKLYVQMHRARQKLRRRLQALFS